MPLERNAVTQTSPGGGFDPVPIVIGVAGATLAIPAGQFGMGGFFSDTDGYLIAAHASDGSAVTTDSPAHAGETIVAYADDFFDVWPPPPIGLPVPAQPPFTINQGLTANEFLFATAPSGSSAPGFLGNVGLYLQNYPTYALQGIPGAGFYGFVTTTPALQITYEGLAPARSALRRSISWFRRTKPPGTGHYSSTPDLAPTARAEAAGSAAPRSPAPT